MKILQVTGPNSESVLLDVPTPEPGAGEARVRILGVATCPQWDLHLRHNEPMFVGHQFFYPYTPGQPGHEATGIVDALGSGAIGLEIGDRVSVWRDPGHNKTGCYAEFVVRPVADLIRVPAHLPPAATAPVELAMCVSASFLRLNQMNAFPCTRFGISGLGPAGLIAAQLARAEGAKEIIAWDLSEARRKYALEKGIVDVALDPRTDVTSTPPEPVEVSLDCVGAKQSVESLMDKTHGILALFGVQREPYTFNIHHYSRLILCGYPGHSRAAAEYAVQRIAEGVLDLSLLITHTLPFSRYAEGIGLLEKQEAIKILFVPE
jgi:threonine dehydrogenase-like Zn-dependent dehydrogenase